MKKKKNIFLGLLIAASLLLTIGCDLTVPDDDGSTTVYEEIVYNLRDTGPAGGLIFYINPNYATDGWKYLESWTADESGTYRSWGNPWKTSNTWTAGTLTAIGTGYANTYTYMTGEEHPAAEVCRNANHGGYDDWFLPSKDELYEMCWVLHSKKWNGSSDEDNPAYGTNRVGGFVNSGVYWSSSESDMDIAWGQYFGSGSQNSHYKGTSDKRVRAVRAF